MFGMTPAQLQQWRESLENWRENMDSALVSMPRRDNTPPYKPKPSEELDIERLVQLCHSLGLWDVAVTQEEFFDRLTTYDLDQSQLSQPEDQSAASVAQ